MPEYQAQLAQEAQSNDNIDKSTKLFATYDVIETSYHFVSNQIVLHLCDDAGRKFLNNEKKAYLLIFVHFLAGRSCHPNLKDGGALQISVKRFQIDYYPYHLAKGIFLYLL